MGSKYIRPAKEASVELYFDNSDKAFAMDRDEIVIERIVRASSKDGDLVLDPFIGTGTTALVCKNLKRSFIGFEIDPKLIAVCEKRLRNVDEELKKEYNLFSISNKVYE